MVDFGKRLKKPVVDKPLDPVALYETLDRKSDKGPLRAIQRAVLEEWHAQRRNTRDVILKMHTGQGKTLVGLLMLQARLNAGDRRAVYLCPNRFLAAQTLSQAEQFGIVAESAHESGELPEAFLNGDAILVTTVHKLFNGRTRFGTGATSIAVDSILLDDAHACVDAIKDACVITLPRDHPSYNDLLSLFGQDLADQGVGTFADISNKSAGAFLPVPYWAWIDRYEDVAATLSRHADTDAIRFTWPILRDALKDCLCVISGTEISIAPYLPPLGFFGSYEGAKHRVFMSATVTDDSFLVRGLGLSRDAILSPLVDPAEAWSGEKMILLPSLIDGSLDRDAVVSLLAPPQKERKFGIVALVPSFEFATDWKQAGATVAKKADIDEQVASLRKGPRTTTLAIANRYDGIDLPDAACRILVLDGRPQGAALQDRYLESCRPGSVILAARTARIIEQGLGRAVRGEKDYCVALLIASDLVKLVRLRETREHFSNQTRAQVELGIQVSEYARDELPPGGKPLDALLKTMNQCLRRDDAWKEFYVERMNSLAPPASISTKMLDVHVAEREAELLHQAGATEKAIARLQSLVDGPLITTNSDKGWYLQEMARYRHLHNQIASNTLQVAAHSKNRYLLKPRSGMSVSQLVPRSQRRVEAIAAWMRKCGDHEALYIGLESILSDLRFAVAAERFETALNNLAEALGFSGERPDKEWKEGPDNLWAIRSGDYVLFECKSEVESTRDSINKQETGQMNNSCAWFAREYPGAYVASIMVIPTKKLGHASGFTSNTRILRARGLGKLVSRVRAFFAEFRGIALDDVSLDHVGTLLETHQLQAEQIVALSEVPTTA